MKKILILLSFASVSGCTLSDMSRGQSYLFKETTDKIGESIGIKPIKFSDIKFIETEEGENPHPDWPFVKCNGKLIHHSKC